MKTIIKTLAIFAMAAALVSCGNRNAEKKAAEAAAEQARLDSLKQIEMEQKVKNAEAIMATLPEEPVFDIVTNLGTMKIRLYSKTEKHRDNFAKLALTGFYDGLLFHRVIDGFMIQGGDPFTKDSALVAKYGTGGPGYTIPAEILPEYNHKKGALAAARMGDMANPMRESSGSQFYIVQDERACSALDGQYTVYGETIEGLDVIDKIAKVATNNRDLPLNPVRIIAVKLDESCISAKDSE